MYLYYADCFIISSVAFTYISSVIYPFSKSLRLIDNFTSIIKTFIFFDFSLFIFCFININHHHLLLIKFMMFYLSIEQLISVKIRVNVLHSLYHYFYVNIDVVPNFHIDLHSFMQICLFPNHITIKL